MKYKISPSPIPYWMPTTIFIAQTPYHVLMALGLSSPNDVLQVIDDFQGSQTYVGLIRKHYPQLSVPNVLPGRATAGEKMGRRVKQSRRNIRAFKGLVYHHLPRRIILFNDRTPETQYAAFLGRRIGAEVVMAEDGLAAYLPAPAEKGNPIRELAGKLLFGLFYRSITTLGTSGYAKGILVFFPELVVPALSGMDVRQLSAGMFDKIDVGLLRDLIGNCDLDFEGLLVLPHSEMLSIAGAKTPTELRADLEKVTMDAIGRLDKVAVKYHPREGGDYLGDYEGCVTLPRSLPLEVVYLMLRGRRLKEVIGPWSTSLYTARIILGSDVRIMAMGDVESSLREFAERLRIGQYQMP